MSSNVSANDPKQTLSFALIVGFLTSRSGCRGDMRRYISLSTKCSSVGGQS